MRLLVTGGRDYSDEATVTRVLNEIMPAVLIVGDARGADALAREWATATNIERGEPVLLHVFDADWDRYGKRAGPIRNQRMLDQGRPDLVLAFPGGRGTEDMCRRAKAAGVPVLRVDE